MDKLSSKYWQYIGILRRAPAPASIEILAVSQNSLGNRSHFRGGGLQKSLQAHVSANFCIITASLGKFERFVGFRSDLGHPDPRLCAAHVVGWTSKTGTAYVGQMVTGSSLPASIGIYWRIGTQPAQQVLEYIES